MRKCKGLTLTELMIALLLATFLLGVTFTAFGSLSRSVRQTQQLAQLQQNAQLVMNLLHNELANVGFWGGRSDLDDILQAAALAPPLADCAKAGLDSGSFPRPGQSFVTLYAEKVQPGRPLDCVSQPIAGSELLQVKRLLGQYAVPAAMRQNRFYVETDWQHARFVDSGSAELNPALDYFPYQHLVLYLQTQQHDDTEVPVLMRKRLARSNSGQAVISTDSVLDGVERMHFQFGVDADGDGSLNYMLPTEQMTAELWQRNAVVSLRYHILLRSTQPDIHYRNNQTYQLGVHRFTAPDDHYRRLLISNSVYFSNATLN